MDEADVVKMEDTCPTSDLPPEIWSQIFTFLPLADRKAVRLTCRSWYDSSTSGNITKHEKFVFRAYPGVEHMAAVLLRSSSSLLNLEFEGLPFKMVPENVWKACGPRIRELELHNCQWRDETISTIILHCENMTSLVITQHAGAGSVVPIAYSSRVLNDFTEKGIRRPKLHTLCIFIKYDEHESDLRKIFLLHPCIKHFTFTLISDESILDPFMLRLDKCLNPDTQLESLTPVLRTPEGLIGILVDQTERGLRLKHLEMHLRYNRMILPNVDNRIFNFFRSQRNLEVLKFMTPVANKQLVYYILESCPKLRVFRLNTHRLCSMTLKQSEVSRFITAVSKLKFLELDVELERSEQVPLFSDLLPNTVQLDLTALYWRCAINSGSDFRVAFLQRCLSLKHLRLARCCDTTLQIIFQQLPELQTLVLEDLSHCTEFGFFGLTKDGNEAGYSIKRLQCLKHLELLSYPIILTERTALELQLSRLEYLSLHAGWYKELSEEGLNHFASRLSKLRTLAIYHCHRINVEETIRLCKHLNNLHHLILFLYFAPDDGNFSLSKKEVDSIISACPSLRCISDFTNGAYKRDPFTGKARFEECVEFPRNIFEF